MTQAQTDNNSLFIPVANDPNGLLQLGRGTKGEDTNYSDPSLWGKGVRHSLYDSHFINKHVVTASAGDFNGDGKDDLWYTGGTPGYSAIMLSQDTTESSPQTHFKAFSEDKAGGFSHSYYSKEHYDVEYADGYVPISKLPYWCWGAGTHYTFTVGDFDGNGRDDLLCHHVIDGIAEYLGIDVVLRAPAPHRYIDAPSCVDQFLFGENHKYSTHIVIAGDFNGDGKDDLLCSNLTGGHLLRLNQGNLTFSKWSPAENMLQDWCTIVDINNLANVDPSNVLPATRIGDFNGDGKDDIWCANGKNYFAISTGDGFKPISATYSDGYLPLGGEESWCNNRAAHVGDFNGDGKDDLWCADKHSDKILLSTGKGFVSVNPDNSSGEIKILQSQEGKGWCYSELSRIAHVGDFNGDGKDDLWCGDFGNNYFALSNIPAFSYNIVKVHGIQSISWWDRDLDIMNNFKFKVALGDDTGAESILGLRGGQIRNTRDYPASCKESLIYQCISGQKVNIFLSPVKNTESSDWLPYAQINCSGEDGWGTKRQTLDYKGNDELVLVYSIYHIEEDL